jgi:fermentation-respiration switch protein FrsA (DUF1100 family)
VKRRRRPQRARISRLAGIAWAFCLALAITSCGGSSTPTSPLSYNRNQPLDAHTHTLQSAQGMQLRAVTYRASDGQPVPALFAIPDARRRPGPCLIYQGGIGQTKEQAAFLFPGLARLGLATFAIDARFTGDRGGSAALARALDSPALLVELLKGTVLDLRRGIDYLQSTGVCEPSRIGFAGLSFGGLVGTLLAGSDERVRATVLMSVGGNFPSILARPGLILPDVPRTPAALAPILRQLAPYDPTRWVGRISPRPVLFVNGLHDPSVPVALARLLQSKARQPKQVFFDDGGHVRTTPPTLPRSTT